MDISDILKDLNRDNDPFADDYSNGQPTGQADLQALTRAWINERGALDLLPYISHPSSNTQLTPPATPKTT
jgi:GINS complex subunit 4